jgi:anti-sigma28 factor (negative regulator of flagellin synthesis)
MTVLDTRYVQRDRMTGPARDRRRRLFERSSTSNPPTDGGMTKVQQLQEQIDRGTYTVDNAALAAAIIRRLQEGRP